MAAPQHCPGTLGGNTPAPWRTNPTGHCPAAALQPQRTRGTGQQRGPRVAQPQGGRSSPRWGSGCRLPGPLSLGGTQHSHLLRTDLGPITGSGPKCSWLGIEGCSRGGGTVAAPPSLLTLQLEADAAGLGPGQPGGRRWGPPIPLCLAGAPRPQELALLAEEVDGRRAAVGTFTQHGARGSLG